MNRLDDLARDPVIGPYLPELAATVNGRSHDIHCCDKKGVALARALDGLPDVRPSSTDVDQARIGTADDLAKKKLHLSMRPCAI